QTPVERLLCGQARTRIYHCGSRSGAGPWTRLLMRTRTILYTGKGGVGKTSVAACTGRACASSGLRTLVISTDPAHSLSESLDEEVGGTPTRVSPRLWGQEVDAQAELERHWSGVQQWLAELLIERGVDRISAEELTVP